MTKCLLLGAGASFGHDEKLPYEQRPPLGHRLFSAGWESGLLKREDFASLLYQVCEYVGEVPDDIESGDMLECDAEMFLRDLHENHPTQQDNNSVNINTSVQESLGTCYYYFFELFRRYSAEFSPARDNYTKMIEKLDASDLHILSLNYDTLLEQSITFSGIDYSYFSSNFSKRNTIPVSKLHGSINWVNKFPAEAIYLGDSFADRIKMIHSNSMRLSGLKILDLEKYSDINYHELACGTRDTYEPALIPPFDSAKDYGKVDEYKVVWEISKKMLGCSDELVILGCGVKENDSRLLTLLSNDLCDDTDITVVSGRQSEEIANRLSKLTDASSFNTDYRYFGDYVEAL
ncbi:SIR2 family protein [Halomarina ordinaria]|uniref:SIR2 family protein n=1 Tax=Halomarina ordinaria TaxID=3033939 RepID=A0ABD5U9R9_9EURY|nr:SIR2 family protein [Halomarina sp. PSRA2]